MLMNTAIALLPEAENADEDEFGVETRPENILYIDLLIFRQCRKKNVLVTVLLIDSGPSFLSTVRQDTG